MKKWLVGITGGIAAYKTPELVRLLKKQDKEVRVVLSEGAKHFVAPMALQAVSGNPVYSELFDSDFEAAMGHIELARWAEGIIIAPLSANRLAALAMGMADDLLTTLCLATRAPIWVAPAMNQQMWHHPATQHNINILKSRGIQILGPDFGEQACLEVGLGRMLEPENIVNQISVQSPANAILKDLKILITAGPTREALDPIRYISNRSSGKMGYALAEMAIACGAQVKLISGPVCLPTPPQVTRVDVVSALEMYETVKTYSEQADIFISAAAVADFRPEHPAPHKMKKQSDEDPYFMHFVENPDILASVAAQKYRPFCVGFAAETQNLELYGLQKLQEKNLDMIAVNDVSREDTGLEVDQNALKIFTKERKSYFIEKTTKRQAALALLEIISEHYAKYQTQTA